MANVLDVAQDILDQFGALSGMKLQKLVYYCQAWRVVWNDEPLFDDVIEAWENGPVSPRLFAAHRGQSQISSLFGADPTHLSPSQRETIDVVLARYGNQSAQSLSELSHTEAPWRKARKKLEDGDRSNGEITPTSMHEFYGSPDRS